MSLRDRLLHGDVGGVGGLAARVGEAPGVRCQLQDSKRSGQARQVWRRCMHAGSGRPHLGGEGRHGVGGLLLVDDQRLKHSCSGARVSSLPLQRMQRRLSAPPQQGRQGANRPNTDWDRAHREESAVSRVLCPLPAASRAASTRVCRPRTRHDLLVLFAGEGDASPFSAMPPCF